MSTAACPHCQRPLPPAQERQPSRCLFCGGAWIRAETMRRVFGEGMPVSQTAPSRRACPDCVAPLTVVTLGPVEVDTCRACGGTFFDRGEVEKVKQIFEAWRAQAGAVPPRMAPARGGGERELELPPAGPDEAPLELVERPKRQPRTERGAASVGAGVLAASAALAASTAGGPSRGGMDVVGSVAGGALDVVGSVASGAVEVLASVDAGGVASALFSVLGFVFED